MPGQPKLYYRAADPACLTGPLEKRRARYVSSTVVANSDIEQPRLLQADPVADKAPLAARAVKNGPQYSPHHSANNGD